jgi:hypothetical protein
MSPAAARCMTPFSGPSQRTCESWVRRRANSASPGKGPITSGVRASIAARHTSLPRPMVNVKPCPSWPSSVRRTQYAAE